MVPEPCCAVTTPSATSIDQVCRPLPLLSTYLTLPYATPEPPRNSTRPTCSLQPTISPNPIPLGPGNQTKSSTMADVPLQVISENSSSERRITPSWTISQLRSKLEPITGIPPSSQRISLKTASASIPIEAADEDNAHLTAFPLAPYAELHVSRAVFCYLYPFSARLWRLAGASPCPVCLATTVQYTYPH